MGAPKMWENMEVTDLSAKIMVLLHVVRNSGMEL
jgi:hypothetical protein